MKKIFYLMLFFLGIFGLVSYANTWCYQETANVSTVCGGLDTGLYECSGIWAMGNDCKAVYDTNWSFGGWGLAGNTGYLEINYTKPTNATNDSLWQVRDGSGITNLTIPSACWNYNDTTLVLRGYASDGANTGVWQCHDNGLIREYYNTNDDSQGAVYGNSWSAQTWNTSTNLLFLYKIGVKVFKVGNPGIVNVSLYPTNDSGEPDCSGDPLSYGSFNGNSITTLSPGEWVNITMNGNFIGAPSTKYAIVMNLSGNAGNYIDWRVDGSSPSYDGGMKAYSNDGGTTWTLTAGTDTMFEIYEIPDWYTLRDGGAGALYEEAIYWNMTEASPTPSDSCTYSGSGDWYINGVDNCNISISVDLLGNDLIFNETGITTITGNIFNTSSVKIISSTVIIKGGNLSIKGS